MQGEGQRQCRAALQLAQRSRPLERHAVRVRLHRRQRRVLRLALRVRPRDDDLVAECRVVREVPPVHHDALGLLDHAVRVRARRVHVVHLDGRRRLVHVRPAEVRDGPLQLLERGDGDLVAVLRSELARGVHRAGELAVDAQPVAEVDALAVAAELLDGLDEAVECAAHVVELSAHVAGLEGVLDDLVGAQGVALGDDWPQEGDARVGVFAGDDPVLEFGFACHLLFPFLLLVIPTCAARAVLPWGWVSVILHSRDPPFLKSRQVPIPLHGGVLCRSLQGRVVGGTDGDGTMGLPGKRKSPCLVCNQIGGRVVAL